MGVDEYGRIIARLGHAPMPIPTDSPPPFTPEDARVFTYPDRPDDGADVLEDLYILQAKDAEGQWTQCMFYLWGQAQAENLAAILNTGTVNATGSDLFRAVKVPSVDDVMGTGV